MSHRTISTLFALLVLVFLMVVTITIHTPVQAQSIPTNGNEDKCMNCHENLYFLHDTGNWFCVQESPMRCVDCHGGNPEAVTQETAHLNRAAHPIINEDVSKCQQCHPEECNERVEFFDQTAGISQVRVAEPYTPAYLTEYTAHETLGAQQQEKQAGGLLVYWEVISLMLIAGLALGSYIIHRTLHKKIN